MKNIFTILGLIVFISINAQTEITFKRSDYNLQKIISELFDARYNEQTKDFIWKPNFAEKLDFGVSADGYLYTEIDTILTYNHEKKIETIVATTYIKDNNGLKEGFHASSPSLSLISFSLDDSGENIQLLYFKKFVTKYGSWGEPSQVGLLQFSENDYYIKVTNGYTGQGITEETVSLYYKGNLAFIFNSYYGNTGYTENIKEQEYGRTDIKIDKINKIITLTKKETEYSEKTKKQVQINKTTKYKISDNPGLIEQIHN